jgi:hypothetical protein
VLHRLRFLSEQAPFESATFSYAFPLLRFILTKGGVETEDPEAPLEQVTLALDFIRFHVADCKWFGSLPFLLSAFRYKR